MPYNIEARGQPNQIVEWLVQNAGPVLWARPNMEWHGRGWSMHSIGFERGTGNGLVYLIRLDNERAATLAALRWS